jgi:hypothetical protein
MHATNQSQAQTQLRAILDNNVFIEWVPVDLIDRTPYARPISTVMLKRMVEAARVQSRKQTQDNMGVVTLTLQPTGRYNCVDGNHRTALARALGLETILARIVIDLSPEQEAQLFEMIHTVHLPTAQDRFRARLYRYDPVALDIQSILRHNGLDIAPSKRTTPGKLVAVAALDQVYTQMGPAALRMVIEIIVAAWGTDDSRAYVGSMLQGMAVFLLRYSNKLDRSRLIEKLQTVTPARLLADASSSGAAVREAPSSKVGKVILRLYNHGLRGNSKFLLPDWIDRPGTLFKVARDLARADVEHVRSGVPQK